MLPQVYWMVICEKEIDKHSRGGRGGALCLSPRTRCSSRCAREYFSTRIIVFISSLEFQ